MQRSSFPNTVGTHAGGNLRHAKLKRDGCVDGQTSQCSQERSKSKIIAHGAETAHSPDVDEAMVRT